MSIFLSLIASVPFFLSYGETRSTTIRDGMDALGNYLSANPITTAMMYLAELVGGGGIAGRRGYSLPAVLGAAVLSLPVPHVLNYVGKTISNSCAAQDGYCNGLITTGKDYAKANPITTAASAIAGIAGVYLAPNPFTPLGTMLIAAPYAIRGISKGGTALLDAASESATNGWIKDVSNYAYDNPMTTATSAIAAGSVLGELLARGRSFGIRFVAAHAAGAGLGAAIVPHVLNYVVGKTISNSCTTQDVYCSPITRIIDAISESRQNSSLKAVEDYVRANPITTAATAIAGIAGSVLGPVYSQTAITNAGIEAFNAMMVATITAAAQHGPVTLPTTQAALVAANKVRSATVLGQTLGRGLVSGFGTAIVPHVLNYVGKTISNSCTAQDGYCNRGITAISKIGIGS